MSRKLLEITPQYSSFVDDQVLTSAKLNEFMEYFDEQDRLTRVCLTGVGIACGFRVEFDATTSQIVIHQGCGITTDGDLIKLQNDIEVEEEAVSGSSFKNINEMVDSITFTHSKLFTDEHVLYQPFQDEGSVITLHELVSDEDASEDEEASLLTSAVLENKVVVLYLECYEKDADICTTTNCDNQGQPNIQNVKVLLIDKDAVENIVNSEDSIFNKHNIYETILALPRTAVQRVILNGESGGNNNISNYAEIAATYKTKITNAKNELNTAFGDFFLGFSELLNISNGVSNTILNQIDDLDNFSNDERVQYRYTLTKNVSDTFNEIADLLLKLKAECCPDIHAFPKHLLLGCLESEKVYPELRHSFYHAPVNNDYHTIIKKVKSLIERVRFMLDNFNLNNAQEIEITPSLSCGPLGSKAIPVYFDVDEFLLKAWDFDKTENYKQQYNLSFHKSLLAPGSWVQNPLNVELDCTDLYRIEGHFGEEPSQSKNFVDSTKSNKGLDFDCLMFDIDKDKEEFSAFVRENPSITHKGGVDKGGTFILLSNDKEILADFTLSYKIAPESGGIGCCKLIECSYPWISSLKYLNNLSRSLLGTQSKNMLMPQEYVFTVLSYKINGQPLISSQQIIRIPMGEIFLRRMHAVTAALNNKFPEGVVFDYNEDQKRLLIIRAKDDTFSIRLKESSLNTDNAVYSYSNNGMFKDNKVFRPKSMICRDIDGAKPSFYRSLHKQYDPSITKDDDYGSYDEKWRKWENLVFIELPKHELYSDNQVRFITRQFHFPSNIRAKLESIRDAFIGIDQTIELYIDGDWVNGTWVDDQMLKHYNANKDDKNDAVVSFINLRASLHNKAVAKTTKLSVYIGNINYDESHQAIIDRFCHDADFYYSVPTGNTMREIR
ncbi:hypothetical protein [Flavivirga jejuensis]|uniref:Uncharacterized protein n=1 Tax=Flavivirga jejuensis TaxID=870487 RepID=A0ABT8WPX9_9FLAO|nr:hypothetical protein [Flavivirga jejuensis]MDO5975209.1 hypothetical protein [Flavivirga jejuensis]